MKPKELIKLIEKYELGMISTEELAVLEAYYAAMDEGSDLRIDPARKEEIRSALKDAIATGTEDPAGHSVQPMWYTWSAAAAAILLIAGLSIFLFPYIFERGPDEDAEGYHMTTDIGPGGHRATLTLADGRVMELSGSHAGIVTEDGNVTYPDGTTVIHDEPLADPEDGVDRATTYSYQLATPNGGTYELTLPDGSRVWLNAGSTLTYPDRFAGAERIVELEGEAYFEVVPSLDTHRPFLVKTNNQVVKVLGTQFNVSAYADDAGEATTLVSGAVSLLNTRSGLETRLAPGQQGVIKNGQIHTRELDPAPFIAWKEGKFLFEDKTFEQVMKELSRWYDIDVKYEGQIPKVEFYGGGYRSSNLSLVLRMLQSADLHYTLEGKTLTIREQLTK